MSVLHHALPHHSSCLTHQALDPREQEVLTLLVDGASNQAIADALIITPNTTNRVQAALRARALNVLSPPLQDTPRNTPVGVRRADRAALHW